MLAPLSSIDIAHQLENAWVMWQGPPRNGQFRARTVIVEIAAIKMLRLRQMRFSAFGSQLQRARDGCLRQGQSDWGVFDAVKINVIVDAGQLTIGCHERWVAGNRVIQQTLRLGEIPPKTG